MAYEYKTVGGPERGKRRRDCHTPSQRAAAAMEELIQAEAQEGWEYLRTDLIAVEERPGFLSRRQVMHCSVLVFRRAVPDRRDLRGPTPEGERVPPRVTAPPPREERAKPLRAATPKPRGGLFSRR